MNKTELIGRLTADPDIRYSTMSDKGQLAIARFTLAVNRKGKNEETDFIRCVAFGGIAEVIEKYVHKGYRVGIAGRIQTGSYQNKDGQTVYTTDVVAEDLDLLEPKKEDKQANNDNKDTGFMEIPDNVDDVGLPFNF